MLKPLAIATFLAASLPAWAGGEEPPLTADDFVIDTPVESAIACLRADDMLAIVRAGRIFDLEGKRREEQIDALAKLVATRLYQGRCRTVPMGSIAETTARWIDGYFVFGIFHVIDGVGSFGPRNTEYYTPVWEWTLVR